MGELGRWRRPETKHKDHAQPIFKPDKACVHSSFVMHLDWIIQNGFVCLLGGSIFAPRLAPFGGRFGRPRQAGSSSWRRMCISGVKPRSPTNDCSRSSPLWVDMWPGSTQILVTGSFQNHPVNINPTLPEPRRNALYILSPILRMSDLFGDFLVKIWPLSCSTCVYGIFPLEVPFDGLLA